MTLKNTMADMPQHVAIIMDGNGRWARSRGLPRPAGHRASIKVVRVQLQFSVIGSIHKRAWPMPWVRHRVYTTPSGIGMQTHATLLGRCQKSKGYCIHISVFRGCNDENNGR